MPGSFSLSKVYVSRTVVQFLDSVHVNITKKHILNFLHKKGNVEKFI